MADQKTCHDSQQNPRMPPASAFPRAAPWRQFGSVQVLFPLERMSEEHRTRQLSPPAGRAKRSDCRLTLPATPRAHGGPPPTPDASRAGLSTSASAAGMTVILGVPAGVRCSARPGARSRRRPPRRSRLRQKLRRRSRQEPSAPGESRCTPSTFMEAAMRRAQGTAPQCGYAREETIARASGATCVRPSLSGARQREDAGPGRGVRATGAGWASARPS